LFYGSPPLAGRHRPTVINSTATAESCGHPCPKPLAWMLWVVEIASLVGETILDPFMGSGTTGVACVQLERKFIGIEIEPKYFDIACRRISNELKQPRLPFVEPKAKPKTAELFETVSACI